MFSMCDSNNDKPTSYMIDILILILFPFTTTITATAAIQFQSLYSLRFICKKFNIDFNFFK